MRTPKVSLTAYTHICYNHQNPDKVTFTCQERKKPFRLNASLERLELFTTVPRKRKEARNEND